VIIDSFYEHVMAVLTPVSVVITIAGARGALRRNRAARAGSAAVEREPLRALPADEPSRAPAPAVMFVPNANPAGAATTIGTSFTTPSAPFALLTSVPTFGSSMIAPGTAAAF
jgi:hypothetical protein